MARQNATYPTAAGEGGIQGREKKKKKKGKEKKKSKRDRGNWRLGRKSNKPGPLIALNLNEGKACRSRKEPRPCSFRKAEKPATLRLPGTLCLCSLHSPPPVTPGRWLTTTPLDCQLSKEIRGAANPRSRSTQTTLAACMMCDAELVPVPASVQVPHAAHSCLERKTMLSKEGKKKEEGLPEQTGLETGKGQHTYAKYL